MHEHEEEANEKKTPKRRRKNQTISNISFTKRVYCVAVRLFVHTLHLVGIYILFSHLLAIVNKLFHTQMWQYLYLLFSFIRFFLVSNFFRLFMLSALLLSVIFCIHCSVDRLPRAGFTFLFSVFSFSLFSDSFHCLATLRLSIKTQRESVFFLSQIHQRHTKRTPVDANRLLLQQFRLINIIFIGK